MVYTEALEEAKRFNVLLNRPIAVTRCSSATIGAKNGEYRIHSFIPGQNVKIGTVFTTLGILMNSYEEVVFIVE